MKVYASVSGKPSADLYPNASKWYEAVSAKLASRYYVFVTSQINPICFHACVCLLIDFRDADSLLCTSCICVY